MLPALSAGGVRVLAVDCRGQFETGDASPAPSYSQDDLANDLVAVTRSLGAGPVHLLGHSYGGSLVRAAVIATQGDSSLWASATLMNFGPGGVSSWQRERLHMLLSVVESMSLAEIWPFVRSKDESVSEDVERFLERRWVSNSPSQLAAAAHHMLDESDTTAELAKLTVPVSVVSGTPDETWPPDGVERMAHQLGATFVRIEGGGIPPMCTGPPKWLPPSLMSGSPRTARQPSDTTAALRRPVGGRRAACPCAMAAVSSPPAGSGENGASPRPG